MDPTAQARERAFLLRLKRTLADEPARAGEIAQRLTTERDRHQRLCEHFANNGSQSLSLAHDELRDIAAQTLALAQKEVERPTLGELTQSRPAPAEPRDDFDVSDSLRTGR